VDAAASGGRIITTREDMRLTMIANRTRPGWPVGLVLLVGVVSLAADGQATLAQGPPEWLRAEFEDLTAGGGRWVADNSAYRSEQEPWDAYGLEWTWGIGRQSVKGRLYGISKGEEKASFWEYRLVWHPAERQAILHQFGAWGSLGQGPMKPAPDGGTELEQTFHEPDGRAWKLRHTETSVAGERRSKSFDWVDGAWKETRTYVWRLAK